MKKIFILCSLYLFAETAQTQILHKPIAAGYTGIGANSLNHVDVFSFTSNQAALAQIKYAAIGLYGERRFLLSELNYFKAVLALPTSTGNFGLKTLYYGFSDYNETQIGLAYGRKLGTKVDIGAQFNYNAIRISGYGNASAINFEIGTILHLTEKMHTGIHANNPVGGKFGKNEEEKLPSVYTIGLGYDASEKFFFGAEVVKEEDQPVSVNAGLQYKFIQQLHARMGLSSATSTAWIGVGLNLRSFRIDISSSYHQQLGLTPGLLLLFHFNKKEN